MQRINAHLHSKNQPPYVLNLDPAVLSVPFEANIDIRDSINYKEVMKQYNLGPNGGILTSLNLFATKVDQILSLMEKRARPSPETKTRPPRHFLVDTPGQIEVFVWSASGSILLESLASSFPTVIAYIIDTPRTSSTSTFMSNMLYACSILYKTKLPMILVFNKTDVQDADFAKEWMTDFEKFQEALRKEEDKGVFGGEGAGGGSGYMSSLLNSMSLMLEEFYSHLSMVAVSSTTGDGVDSFFEAVESKREEFNRDYKPELEKRRKQRQEEKVTSKEQELAKVMQDLNVSAARRRPVPKDEPDVDVDDEDTNDPDQYPDEMDEDRTDDDDLSSRYRAALKASGVKGGDESFAKYLASSQANK
jgi:GPN-loop GTPase